MGCDIHIYTEVKIKDKWTCVDPMRLYDYEQDSYVRSIYITKRQIYEGRNYYLFGALAGVRCYGGPDLIDSPRGIPLDVSDVIQEISDFELEHTPCWLSLSDLKQYKWYKQNKCYKDALRYFFSRRIKNSTVNKLTRLQKKYKVTSEEIRVVFWFDS